MEVTSLEFIVTCAATISGSVFLIGRKVQKVLDKQDAHSAQLHQHDARQRNTEIRNCAHHGLIFDKMGITHNERVQAEVDAGVLNPGTKT